MFKPRLTKNVKRKIEKLASERDWGNAGHGFEAKESAVRLMGWTPRRHVGVIDSAASIWARLRS